MSFPSLNNTSDYDVYTTKYLQSLALQIQLNQNNFDKNVGYMKTGVQDTERPDSRSIEERAGDVEKLKVQARVMLNKISDATNANEVLDYLAKNGELLFFFIQQFPTIEKLVKEQYTGGVRAPILISLIYKRFISQQEDSLMPESADFDIISKVMTTEDVDVLLNETSNKQLKQKLLKVRKNLPPKSKVKQITDDPVRYKDELKFYAEMLKNSPNVDIYNKLIDEYNDAPLKDNINNMDLENAEQNMINIIQRYLGETSQFQNVPSFIKTVKKIQKDKEVRTTKTLPTAQDTRITPTTERERELLKGRKKTVEDITATQFDPTQFKLKPAGQRAVKPKELTLLSELKLGTPQLKSATLSTSNVSLSDQLKQEELAQKVDMDTQRRKKALEELSTKTSSLKKTDTKTSQMTLAEQLKIESDIQEKKEKRDKKLAKILEKRKQENEIEKENKEKELKRIIDEMEQLKREKQIEEGKQMSKLKDNPNEPEKIDEYNQIVKRRPGRPRGSKDKNPRDRTGKTQMSLARRLEALQQPIYPETPTEIEEKALARRLEALQQPTLPKAPTTTPKKKIKVVQTGTGLLNQQEQLTHRFKVLKGEILAGNTASQVIKEMKSLVKQLVKSGELSLEQQSGILKELKTL